MRGQLTLAHARNRAPGVGRAFRDVQSLPPYVRRQNLHVPRIGERQSVRNGNRDGVRFLARRTARAPNAQRAGVFPEFLDVQFRQNALFERFIYSRVPEKRRLLRQQTLEQRLVVRRRFAHCAKELRAAFVSFRLHVLAHTRRKESLARLVERDSRAFMDQHADLAQLVLGQSNFVSQPFTHRYLARAAGLRRERELPLTAERLLGRAARILPLRLPPVSKPHGIARGLRSIDRTISRAGSL